MSFEFRAHVPAKSMFKHSILTTLVALSVIVGNASLTACLWGSPAIGIFVENQTDKSLAIFITEGGQQVGIIAPGQQVFETALLDTGRYPVVARNLAGQVVFSEVYTRMPSDKYQLIETNLRHKGVVRVYRAIIPPLANGDNSTS